MSAPKHDRIPVGEPCLNTGEPYDGYSWSRETPYDTCRACGDESDPMYGGIAPALEQLALARGEGEGVERD